VAIARARASGTCASDRNREGVDTWVRITPVSVTTWTVVVVVVVLSVDNVAVEVVLEVVEVFVV